MDSQPGEQKSDKDPYMMNKVRYFDRRKHTYPSDKV